MEKSNPVILFDGVCNLCSASVQFVIERDPNAYFSFASLQSDFGVNMQKKFGLEIKDEPDSILLIEDGKMYQKSTAALKIASKLKGFWFLTGVFWIFPAFLRDILYNWIAKNRYKWYGKQESCWIPTPALKQRFIK